MDLAVIATEYRKDSHTDVILARWFERIDEDANWGWHGPRSRIVSAYMAQFPDNDLARERFAEQGVPLHDSIPAALRNGGPSLAVDGVLLIGEHGDYPLNRLGQQLYPRSEMFHAIADVCEADGRSVPVFCDKHLSWDFDLARLMHERAEALSIPLLSSSSIPFCRYDAPLPTEALAVAAAANPVDRAVAVFPLVNGGSSESYGYHSLEFVQHALERQQGGAAGLKSIRSFAGPHVWSAAADGEFDLDLYRAAWTHAQPDSPTVDADHETDQDHPTQAFVLEYDDGLTVTHVGVEGFHEFAFAMPMPGQPTETYATVSRTGPGTDVRHSNFAALCRVIEDWWHDGVEPFPVQRALLTAGTLQAMMLSLALPSGSTVPTPHLAGLAYAPTERPVGADFWPAAQT